ncbi:MAG: hypothetical protein V8T01_10865 [Oscillospiraceae bacterium]
MLPAILSLLCDWRIDGTIVWSGYAAGAIGLLYVMIVLPLWFRHPNPVIFVPVDFAAIGLYLLYIDFATGGHWFLVVCLPGDGRDRAAGHGGRCADAVSCTADGSTSMAGAFILVAGGLSCADRVFDQSDVPTA